MTTAHDSARRLSVLHIFEVYYPDLFGGTEDDSRSLQVPELGLDELPVSALARPCAL